MVTECDDHWQMLSAGVVRAETLLATTMPIYAYYSLVLHFASNNSSMFIIILHTKEKTIRVE